MSVWSWVREQGSENGGKCRIGVGRGLCLGQACVSWEWRPCPSCKMRTGGTRARALPFPHPNLCLSFGTTKPNISAKAAPGSVSLCGTLSTGPRAERLQEPLHGVTWYWLYFPGRTQDTRNILHLEKQADWFLWNSCHWKIARQTAYETEKTGIIRPQVTLKHHPSLSLWPNGRGGHSGSRSGTRPIWDAGGAWELTGFWMPGSFMMIPGQGLGTRPWGHRQLRSASSARSGHCGRTPIGCLTWAG